MRKHYPIVLVFVFLCLVATPALAQNAALVGLVKDPQQARIPGATITLKNTETGVEMMVTSDEGGNYEFPIVRPGNYSLRAEQPGFRPFAQSPIVLVVGQRARVDATLDVGDVTAEVSVVAGAATVQTESSALGDVVDTKGLSRRRSMDGSSSTWLCSRQGPSCPPQTIGHFSLCRAASEFRASMHPGHARIRRTTSSMASTSAIWSRTRSLSSQTSTAFKNSKFRRMLLARSMAGMLELSSMRFQSRAAIPSTVPPGNSFVTRNWMRKTFSTRPMPRSRRSSETFTVIPLADRSSETRPFSSIATKAGKAVKWQL